MLFDVIEAGKPIRPCETETWGTRSGRASAIRLFERARAKVDVEVRRYEHRAFRLHRNTSDSKLKAFEFAPPDDLDYCFILPA